LGMSVLKDETSGPRLGLDWCLLFTSTALGLLDVGEVGAHLPGQLARYATLGMVRYGQADRESAPRHDVQQSNRQCALDNTPRIHWDIVAGLPTAFAAVLRDFGVDVLKREDVGLDARGFAEPRPVAIDLEPQRPKKSGFAKIVAGERLIISAL